MTAPLLALDALCGSQACRGHRCPRIRHGYVRGELRGKCSQHRHCRGFELDELTDLDSPEESDATTTPAGTDQAADGCAVAAETADRTADLTASDVTDAAPDSPAGAVDAVTEVAPRQPGDDLPGTSPAPDFGGREEAAPPAAGPAAEAETPLPASAAGRLLGSHVTWWCPRELAGHDLPSAHQGCGTGLIRARVTIREEPDGD